MLSVACFRAVIGITARIAGRVLVMRMTRSRTARRLSVLALRAVWLCGNRYSRFDTLTTHKALDGDKVRIDDILNKAIVVTGFQVSTSKYRDRGSGFCVKVQFYETADTTQTRKVFFSGSSVLKDELEEAKQSLESRELPLMFKTVVKKVGNYYSLT